MRADEYEKFPFYHLDISKNWYRLKAVLSAIERKSLNKWKPVWNLLVDEIAAELELKKIQLAC